MIDLSNISFPIYRVGPDKPTVDENVIFYLQGKDTEYSDAQYRIKIIDDKNRPEPTLAQRRLALRAEGASLAKLSKAIFFIGDFIKLAKSGTWFIDREGTLFTYKKSRRVKLVFRKIAKVTKLQAGGAIIEVQGVHSRFKVLFAPTHEQTHAGLLITGNSHILYGLYDQQYDDTTRMI